MSISPYFESIDGCPVLGPEDRLSICDIRGSRLVGSGKLECRY